MLWLPTCAAERASSHSLQRAQTQPIMEIAEREGTSDDLPPQADRDSSKCVETSKQLTEPLPKPKQELKLASQIQDTATVATLSQQPWTDSQLHELLAGPQQPSQVARVLCLVIGASPEQCVIRHAACRCRQAHSMSVNQHSMSAQQCRRAVCFVAAPTKAAPF